MGYVLAGIGFTVGILYSAFHQILPEVIGALVVGLAVQYGIAQVIPPVVTKSLFATAAGYFAYTSIQAFMVTPNRIGYQ